MLARFFVTRRILTALQAELALALLVCGARLFAFAYAGSPLPYYDQWIAEFHNTFLRIAQGTSPATVLFMRHNEHLLVTTKFLSLIGFSLNGYWDVAFLIVAAAVVRAAEAAWLFRLLAPVENRFARALVWLGCAAVFAGPTSGFNLLCGLQISFGLAELALLAALCAAVLDTSSWRAEVALVAATGIGLWSMGSALAIPVATAVAYLVSGRRSMRFWLGWAVTVGCAVAFAWGIRRSVGSLHPNVPVGERLVFFLQLAAWPVRSAVLGAALLLGTVTAVVSMCRRGSSSHRRRTAIAAGVAVFAIANAAMLAANRAPEEFHPRHWESMALFPLAMLALCATAWSETRTFARPATWSAIALYLAGFGINVWPQSLGYLISARAHRAEALAYHRKLLTSQRMVDEVTGENSTLDRYGQFFYDDPILRFSPHHGVYGSIAREPMKALPLLGPDILPIRPPSITSRIIALLIRSGAVIAAVGLLLGGWVALKARATPVRTVTKESPATHVM